MLLGGLVEPSEVLSAELFMLAEVVVAPMSNAFQLPPAEWEQVLHVPGPLAVMGALFGGMLAESEVVRPDAEVFVPGLAVTDPALEPLGAGAGHDEVLHLHLFELAGAEDEVARRDLV